MAKFYKHKDGRVWVQTAKFQTYDLLLPYGMTNITDPVGNLAVFREPDSARRGKSVIVDVARGEPGLSQFDIETRLQRTNNLLFGMKDCANNFQGHLGRCDRADNYYSSETVIHWERARRGDLRLERIALIEGDNAPDQVTTPFAAEVGPLLFDMNAKFLSQRTVNETEAFIAGAFLESECLDECQSQADAGQYGYAASGTLAGSPVNKANIWYTEDKGESWAQCSADPFIAAMIPSDIIVMGTLKNHRVIVANGTTRGSDPAQIAYADITDMGVTTWVLVDLPTADARYVTDLLAIDWMHIYACTDDGYIYKSDDGGVSWVEVYAAGVVDFNKMAGLSNGTIWAVGNSDLIVLSQDFGDSWTTITGPVGIVADGMAVAVTPDGTVFVGYSDGDLWGSYDLGDAWTELNLQGITPTKVVDIQVYEDSDIWVIADIAGSTSRVLRSVDGGASFRLWKLAIPTNAGLNSLFIVDPNVVFVFGDPQGGFGFISRTTSLLIGL